MNAFNDGSEQRKTSKPPSYAESARHCFDAYGVPIRGLHCLVRTFLKCTPVNTELLHGAACINWSLHIKFDGKMFTYLLI